MTQWSAPGGDPLVQSAGGSAGISQVLLSHRHLVHRDNLRRDGQPETALPGETLFENDDDNICVLGRLWDRPALQDLPCPEDSHRGPVARGHPATRLQGRLSWFCSFFLINSFLRRPSPTGRPWDWRTAWRRSSPPAWISWSRCSFMTRPRGSQPRRPCSTPTLTTWTRTPCLPSPGSSTSSSEEREEARSTFAQ